MNNEYETKRAQQSATEACSMDSKYANSALSGPGVIGGPVRDGLRSRVRRQAEDAILNSRRAERLLELDHLFEKNPDVARIFELMDDVRL